MKILENHVRRLLESRKPAVGVWVDMTDSAVVEMAAAAGFDFVGIQLEHTALDLADVYNHLRAAKAERLPCLTRLWTDDSHVIQRILDAGADAIMVPHVATVHAARRAAAAVRFPPLGTRGMSSKCRATNYGVHGLPSIREFTEWANRNVVLGVMIEEEEAVAHIDDIVSVEGIDIVQIGASDLAASMGVVGNPEDPRLAAAIDRIVDACIGRGICLMMNIRHQGYPMNADELVARGFRMLVAGSDRTLLISALQASRAAAQTAVGPVAHDDNAK